MATASVSRPAPYFRQTAKILALPKLPVDMVAVIDAGSNKFRLVIFDVSQKKPKVIYEAKATPALAKGTKKGHRHLDAQGEAFALKTLEKFRKVIERYEQKGKVIEVYALGTAALRAVKRTDAGEAFLQKAQAALGYTIKVITGAREAVLTGLGMRENGIVFASIGGGSIELGVKTKKNNIKDPSVINLGALSLMEEGAFAEFEKDLKKKALGKAKILVAGGGDWRAIARIISGRMNEEPVPDKFPKKLNLPIEEAKYWLNSIIADGLRDWEKKSDHISDRIEHIPTSARALLAILEHAQPERLTFSKGSIREGVLEARARGENLSAITSHPLKEAIPSSPSRPALVLPSLRPAQGFQTIPGASPA